MRQIKKGGLTEKILSYLGETLKNLFDFGVRVIFDPHSLVRGFSLYHPPGPPPSVMKKEFQKRMNSLKKRGYVKETKDGWELTPKGRIILIKLILWKKLQNKKWDGKWRVIIFDIPELNKRDRDFLRRELRWIGFAELQKSVWVFPYDMEKEILALLKLWKMEFQGDIRFLIAEKITGEEELKKRFGLE